MPLPRPTVIGLAPHPHTSPPRYPRPTRVVLPRTPRLPGRRDDPGTGSVSSLRGTVRRSTTLRSSLRFAQPPAGRMEREVMGSVRGSFLRSFPCPSTRPTRGRSVHRHSGSSSLTFLVTSFLFTSLSSRPFGAHFIRPGTGPLASLASLVRDVPSLGLRPSLPSVGRDKC